MTRTVLINQSGEETGKIPLPKSYFGSKVSEGSVYYTVNALLNNRRQGNASTKERNQVKASSAKPWHQKGTGRARAGTRSSPLWRGGGITFGPHPKDYNVRVPKKIRQAAFNKSCEILPVVTVGYMGIEPATSFSSNDNFFTSLLAQLS